MKIAVLTCSSILVLYSCIHASDTEMREILSVEELKPRVEVEEIDVEIDSVEKVQAQEWEPKQHREIPKQWEDMDNNPWSDSEKERAIFRKPQPKLPPAPFDSSRYLFVAPDFDARIDPLFPGGANEMKKFIRETITYPYRDICVQGRVYVSFVVEKDGCVTNVEVMRGISEAMDQEALRVIHAMPNWIPAQENGKVVAAEVRLPVQFDLN